MYFQDTAEVQEAKARFGDAFADAEAGIVSIIRVAEGQIIYTEKTLK